jgi:FeS assembly SUF system protein
MEKALKKAQMENQIIAALQTVHDPEIPVNVYDLGLIYEINISDDGQVNLVMTLTNPNCPVADTMPVEVRNAVKTVQGVAGVAVEMVFEPEWNKDMMSEAAMLELGLL